MSYVLQRPYLSVTGTLAGRLSGRQVEGSRSSLRLPPRQARPRTDVRQRLSRKGGVKKTQSVRGAAESEAAAAEKMREQIKTFETVLNIDQFLVRAHVRLGSLF